MNGNDGQLPLGRRIEPQTGVWSDFHPTVSQLPKREDYDSDLEFERWKWQDR